MFVVKLTVLSKVFANIRRGQKIAYTPWNDIKGRGAVTSCPPWPPSLGGVVQSRANGEASKEHYLKFSKFKFLYIFLNPIYPIFCFLLHY